MLVNRKPFLSESYQPVEELGETGVRIGGLAEKNVTDSSIIDMKTKPDIFTRKFCLISQL